MTPGQRKNYRGNLWPAACKAQGWDVKDEKRRQQVNLEAVGEVSTSEMDNDQVTLLFDHLKWLADPYDFDKAMPAANPELGWQANRRRQLLYRINRTATRRGLSPEYLVTITAGKCRKYKAASWQDLPLPQLLDVSMTVSARGQAPGKAGAAPLQEACNTDSVPSLVEAARERLGWRSAQTSVNPWVLPSDSLKPASGVTIALEPLISGASR